MSPSLVSWVIHQKVGNEGKEEEERSAGVTYNNCRNVGTHGLQIEDEDSLL